MQLNINLADQICNGSNRSFCDAQEIADVTVSRRYTSMDQVPPEDWAVFAIYFIVTIVIGILSAFRNRGSLEGFFLTARSANWVLVGLSMFAANIGSAHFIGQAGSAAISGIGVAVFELNAIFVLPFLGWFFSPVFLAADVSTMPEYLRVRFGGRRIQIYMSCLALFLYIFTKISADLYAGTFFLDQVLAFPKYLGVFVLLAVAALFTIIGGMTAVLWTNAVQLVIILIGGSYLLAKVLALDEIGGIEQLLQLYIDATPNMTLSNFAMHNQSGLEKIEECGKALSPSQSFHIMQSAEDSNTPWPGVIFGLTTMSIWYWCCDQVIAQHMLASKNLSHAKLGSILAAFLKLISPFLFIIPGMAARHLYTDFVACSDPVLCCCFCSSKSGCSNNAYTILAVDSSDKLSLPPGARGLMAITISAALISSFSSIFNACSAIFTMDIWRLIRPKASSKELQIVGRVFIVIVCTVSMLWMVIISNASNLYKYIQSMTAYFAPPITAIFLLAIFWKRCNEKGAFFGLMIGLLIGIVRFGLDMSYPALSCAETKINIENNHDLRPPALKNVHYLHFAIILFGITGIVTICLSLVTKPPDISRINGLTYWTTNENRICRRPKSRRNSTSSPNEGDNTSNNGFDNRISYGGNAGSCDDLTGDSRAAKKTSKWRLVINWLCGIESNKAADSKADLHRRSAVAHSGKTNEDGVHVMPLSNAIIEKHSMRMLASVLLVILLTLASFFWVLLW